jgi:hypothetical protein
LALKVGQTVHLSASLVDSSGAPLPAPTSVTWSTIDDVLKVDSSGNVTALEAGESAIIATDGVHGRATIAIVVMNGVEPPAGPTGVEFAPPVVQVDVGKVVHVTTVVRDASGNALSSAMSAPSYASKRPEIATVTATGAALDITGVAPGLTVVTPAAASGKPIAGALAVIVRSPLPAGTTSTTCDPSTFVVTDCDYTNGGTAAVISKPGTAYPIRVFTIRRAPKGCNDVRVFYQQQAPDSIVFKTDGVASYDPKSGLMNSIAPGSSTYSTFVGTTQCDVPLVVRVGVDIGGAWTVSGTNGDQGSLTLPNIRGTVRPGATWAGSSGVIAWTLHGPSCVSNPKDGFNCSGDGSSGTTGLAIADTDWLCSDARPCPGGPDMAGVATVGFTTCAPASREGTPLAVTIFGNDHVKMGGYDFTRGASGATCAPPTSGGCDGTWMVSVPAFTCGGSNVPAFSTTVSISGGVATTTDPTGKTSTQPIGSDCTLTGAPTSCGEAPGSVHFAAGGSCTIGFELKGGGKCQCGVTAPCTVTKK